MSNSIPAEQWKWYGEAAHPIVGQYCQFHMATLIGKHMVSTVGKYWPDRAVREIFARTRDKEIVGRGDDWDNDYREKMPNRGWETIGCDRLYETMVFAVTGKECPCGCGLPQIDGSELDFAAYNDPKEATMGHMAMCAKWAESRKRVTCEAD